MAGGEALADEVRRHVPVGDHHLSGDLGMTGLVAAPAFRLAKRRQIAGRAHEDNEKSRLPLCGPVHCAASTAVGAPWFASTTILLWPMRLSMTGW